MRLYINGQMDSEAIVGATQEVASLAGNNAPLHLGGAWGGRSRRAAHGAEEAEGDWPSSNHFRPSNICSGWSKTISTRAMGIIPMHGAVPRAAGPWRDRRSCAGREEGSPEEREGGQEIGCREEEMSRFSAHFLP